jgi:hypothetical protein
VKTARRTGNSRAPHFSDVLPPRKPLATHRLSAGPPGRLRLSGDAVNLAKNSCCTRPALLLGWRSLCGRPFSYPEEQSAAAWRAVFGTGRYLARVGSLDIGRSSKFKIAPALPYPTFVFAKH